MMFPKQTVVNKFLAKERFYSHDAVHGALKQALVDTVEKITIANKLSADTLNIESGTDFQEIIVLHLLLRDQRINERLLDALDKSIRAGYVLFILEYNGQKCASISHKYVAGNNTITVGGRWTTEWAEDIDLTLDGIKIDTVYANLINQISGGRVAANYGNDLSDAVARDAQRQKLEKHISDLESRVWRETQLNKQIALRNQIRTLKQQLEELL